MTFPWLDLEHFGAWKIVIPVFHPQLMYGKVDEDFTIKAEIPELMKRC
jgi:hypothetical protein